MQRIHVIIRLAFLVALGAVGCSSLYWILYLALPATAALLISQNGPQRYLAQNAPSFVRVLRWAAGAYAYLWLLTDRLPTSEADQPVELEVELGGAPSAGSALLRLLSSLPALVLLAILSFAAAVLWVIGAATILVMGRMPSAIADFIAMKLRYQFRLIAYHFSLVDTYPSLEDLPMPHVPHSGAA